MTAKKATASATGNSKAPVSDATRLIGARLRKLREERGWSIREASRRAKLSHTFLALVEEGKTEIAVSRLLNLAETYGVFVTDILADVHDRKPEILRAGDELSVPFGSKMVDLAFLSGPSWQVQPFRLTLQPGARLEDLNHHGDEFLHCVKGSLLVTIGAQEFELRRDDTVIVPEFTDHAYRNVGRSEAVIVGAAARLGVGESSEQSDAGGSAAP